MSAQPRSTLSIVLASTALGVSLGVALMVPLAHQPSPPVSAPSLLPLVSPCDPSLPPVSAHSDPAIWRAPSAQELAAELGGLMPATAGMPVSQGDLVLARWHDGTWWEATVQIHEGESVRVAWRDGSTPSDLPRQHVAPLPREPELLHPGELVLCKWQAHTRWWGARLEPTGQGLGVLYSDGTREEFRGQCMRAEPDRVGVAR